MREIEPWFAAPKTVLSDYDLPLLDARTVTFFLITIYLNWNNTFGMNHPGKGLIHHEWMVWSCVYCEARYIKPGAVQHPRAFRT